MKKGAVMRFWNAVAQAWLLISLALGALSLVVYGTILLKRGATVEEGAIGVLLLLFGFALGIGVITLTMHYEEQASVARRRLRGGKD